MPKKILLITPPFTQLNTPYPASLYLKGFLKLHGHEVFQADLGIELINRIFPLEGFQEIFTFVKKDHAQLSPNSLRIINNEQHYLQTVAPLMRAHRGRNDRNEEMCDTSGMSFSTLHCG